MMMISYPVHFDKDDYKKSLVNAILKLSNEISIQLNNANEYLNSIIIKNKKLLSYQKNLKKSKGKLESLINAYINACNENSSSNEVARIGSNLIEKIDETNNKIELILANNIESVSNFKKIIDKHETHKINSTYSSKLEFSVVPLEIFVMILEYQDFLTRIRIRRVSTFWKEASDSAYIRQTCLLNIDGNSGKFFINLSGCNSNLTLRDVLDKVNSEASKSTGGPFKFFRAITNFKRITDSELFKKENLLRKYCKS